jgi:Flp pilus assembly protein TadD
MPASSITYNPGVLGDEELIRSFVVRQRSLELILETVRENAASKGTNRHLLIVGPRGIGKTMLVRRAAAEVRRDPAYGSHWYPLVFGEETYAVSSSGEFWLEALFHLADQTGETRWEKTVAELRQESDNARLRERALAQLLNFADETGKRLLLVVENLNMLLEEQTPREAGWELRHALMNEPRLMLLGTALRRFEEITNIGRAWFEMFAIHELKPLDHEECRVLWTSATETSVEAGPLRAIRILTGGNPRLLMVLASFAVNRSFRQLMDHLVHLIDDHTEYFKSHLDSLPAKERKVFVALLDHWDPVTASELARATRLHVSEASALVGRLQGRGAVEVAAEKPRRKLYQAAERLYNIYYLMRRRGHPAGRVRAAVNFMVTFYEGQELANRLGELAREACGLPEGARSDHYLAYNDALRRALKFRHDILKCTPPEFFQATDAPDFIRELPVTRGKERAGKPGSLLRKARSLQTAGRFDEAEKLYRKAVHDKPTDAQVGMALGFFYTEQRRHTEAEQAFRRVVELEPSSAMAWDGVGVSLMSQGRLVDAEPAFRRAIDLDATVSWSWILLGQPLESLGRYSEAEEAYRKAIEREPDSCLAWNHLGYVLLRQSRFEGAEHAFRKAIEFEPKNVLTWSSLATSLVFMRRPIEAEQACRKAVELGPTHCFIWDLLAVALMQQDRFDEAEQAIRQAISLDPEEASRWHALSRALDKLGRGDEAEQAIRKAIQLSPEEPANWNRLGIVLPKPKKADEAAAAFRKAIELDARVPVYWSNLGHLLLDHGSADEAEKVWEAAIEMHPDLLQCVGHLLDLRLRRGVDQQAVLNEARKWIERAGDNPEVLSAIARSVVLSNLRPAFPEAEVWARKALAKDPGWENAAVLADVLAAEQKWQEALETWGSVLDASAGDEQARGKAIELLTEAAAAGHAPAALEKLSASSGAQALEPLAVGLRIFMGETPPVAKEIVEVGQDVAQRIRERQKAISGGKPMP